jgi:hypothetical protein
MPDLTELSEGETALRAVERDWNAAAQHWNSAGLVALYTEDAVFYGGRPGHAVGHAKVREYFDSYVGTLAAARLGLVVTFVPKVTLRKPFCFNVLSVYANCKRLKSRQTQLLQTFGP